MKQLFTFPADELKQDDTLYISMVLELHAARFTNEADQIQFDNLIKKAEKKLEDSDYQNKEALSKQLEQIRIHKSSLANHTGGLALYITAEDIYYYDLAIPVENKLVLGKLPYILPLVENFQYEQDYHLLLLSKESARIFEGHGVNIDELDMTEINEDAPVDLETALGTEREGGELSFGTYSSTSGAGDGSSQFFHGHNETSKERDIDREHYFRIVDRFVYDHYSSDKKWPLIVYSIEDNLSVFKSLSDNKYLSDFSILGSPANIKDNEIRKAVSEKITHLIGQEKREAINEIEEISPQNRIENIPDDLASASLRGQIDTLYVEKGLEIPGTLTENGQYDADDKQNNFVKLLVHQAINTDASVYIFDSEDMPENQEILAKLRF
ncbi:MAG: hypothetical protein L0L39_02660 [Atopostipes suicloacalis]|nr:hypothetical protein [Atopostipes suicloacalis]MDN6731063.1 hypothetical protein [Atopostipes suicloacalis]